MTDSPGKKQDAAGHVFSLSGTVPAQGELEVVLTPPAMPMNNDGDEVVLVDAEGVLRSRIKYGKRDVRPGKWITRGR